MDVAIYLRLGTIVLDEETIQGEKTIQGRKLYEEIRYMRKYDSLNWVSKVYQSLLL